MSKYFGGIFAVLLLLWVLYFIKPASQVERVKNFCSPISYIVKSGGSFANIIDKDAGENLSFEGVKILQGGCEENFAPFFLSVFNIYDKEKAALEQKESVLKVVRTEMDNLRKSINALTGPQGEKEFSAEEREWLLKKAQTKLKNLKEIEAKLLNNEYFPVEGVMKKDML